MLSDNELTVLAERMGIYLPEGLDRPFIIEEILSALEDDDDKERVFSHDGTGHVEEKNCREVHRCRLPEWTKPRFLAVTMRQ